jgi:6-pyruvoyltetrahydropterin/6-carboxytetrahydropterin synthase
MTRNYELSVSAEFCAAHRLDGYPGNCKNTHGHNWGVTVYVLCTELDSLGMGLDFRDIKALVKEALASLDHAFLNDLLPFADTNPTAENIARHIYEELSRLLAAGVNTGTARISRVHVAETPGAGVTYWEAP